MAALESTLPALNHANRPLPGPTPGRNFVAQYLSGTISVTRSCSLAPDEPPSTTTEPFSLLSCPITAETNDLVPGILADWTQDIEKFSPTLGRTVPYTEQRRISRLPA